MSKELIIEFVKEYFPILRTILFVIILLIIFNIILKKIRTKLLKKSKSKKQLTNIKILSRLIGISFFIITISIAFFSYFESWEKMGIFIGLITAALGFALQRPITGIAAWIMVVIKRPFQIGDRIAIGNVKGEVYDITLTHIYIDEIGGLIESDLHSGRNVMVPNYLLFEENIINYTLTNDYILGEVLVDVTYESDLNKAIDIAKKATGNNVDEKTKEGKFAPSIRMAMSPSCMTIKIRFYAPIKNINETSSNIIKDCYDLIKKKKM